MRAALRAKLRMGDASPNLSHLAAGEALKRAGGMPWRPLDSSRFTAHGENAMYGAYLHLPRSLALYRVATGALSGRLRLRRIVRVRADSDKSFREMLFKPRGALFLFVGRGGLL